MDVGRRLKGMKMSIATSRMLNISVWAATRNDCIRKLASIQKITKLELIPNSDSLEVATVLGWHVVVKKDEFKEGEIVVIWSRFFTATNSWI